jgi:hypothetical protein
MAAPPSAAALGAQPTPAAPTSFSPLQLERLAFRPGLPLVLAGGAAALTLGAPMAPIGDGAALKKLFPSTYGLPTAHFSAGAGVGAPAGAAARPLRIGCVLSGGQAPGGHNVISGLFDACKAAHAESVLFGFLDGPRGLFTGKFVEITPELMAGYRNMGGFDIIGSGRDKIETPEQFAGVLEFSAPEGVALLPQWMLQNLRLRDGGKALFASVRERSSATSWPPTVTLVILWPAMASCSSHRLSRHQPD